MSTKQLYICMSDGCVSNLQKCPVCSGAMKQYKPERASKAKRFPRPITPQTIEQRRVAGVIEQVCETFLCPGEVMSYRAGPVVTEYKFQPNKMSRVKNLKSLNEDLALAIPAENVSVSRAPAERAMNISVPNKVRTEIKFEDTLRNVEAHRHDMQLPINLGVTSVGDPVVIDLAKQPHMLIAGSTGTGKSVLLNGILCSLLHVRNANELQLYLIDPKQVELLPYSGLPHTKRPPVSNTFDALALMRMMIEEMTKRMSFMYFNRVKNLPELNAILKKEGKPTLPHWVLVIDEFAQLVQDQKKLFNECIGTLTSQARAAGIHIIAATQRTSVDIIKGPIKANFLCRVALRLPSASDSKTILSGKAGAEQLLGNGDIFVQSPSFPGLTRVHSAHCREEDIRLMLERSSMLGHVNSCPADGTPKGPDTPKEPKKSEQIDLTPTAEAKAEAKQDKEDEAAGIISRSLNMFLKEHKLTWEQAQKMTPIEKMSLNADYKEWQRRQRRQRGTA
jgi:DNA segregation ATPase FtsK/SpoIIIE-like protein